MRLDRKIVCYRASKIPQQVHPPWRTIVAGVTFNISRNFNLECKFKYDRFALTIQQDQKNPDVYNSFICFLLSIRYLQIQLPLAFYLLIKLNNGMYKYYRYIRADIALQVSLLRKVLNITNVTEGGL